MPITGESTIIDIVTDDKITGGSIVAANKDAIINNLEFIVVQRISADSGSLSINSESVTAMNIDASLSNINITASAYFHKYSGSLVSDSAISSVNNSIISIRSQKFTIEESTFFLVTEVGRIELYGMDTIIFSSKAKFKFLFGGDSGNNGSSSIKLDNMNEFAFNGMVANGYISYGSQPINEYNFNQYFKAIKNYPYLEIILKDNL